MVPGCQHVVVPTSHTVKQLMFKVLSAVLTAVILHQSSPCCASVSLWWKEP